VNAEIIGRNKYARGIVTVGRGLSEEQVEASRKKHGENKLSRTRRKSFLRRFVENMGDPVIKILLCALAVNIVFMFRDADWFETVGIAISVLLATLISTISEHGSQAAFEDLARESAGAKCRVRRIDDKSGREFIKEIPVSEVVVGDTVLLCAGERIPADGVMISGKIGVDQSGMTGEGKELQKYPLGDFESDASSPCSVFGGCTVLSGEGEMKVIFVGDNTFLGEISKEIQMETRESPLKIRLSKLARQISVLGYVAAGLCALAYLFNVIVIENGFDPEAILEFVGDGGRLVSELIHALTLGLTVVVMAVPEGLPMMIAVVLSSNIKRMVKDNVLVRKPVGIEAAGSMNILFTDKTGTLTEGRMRVGGLILGDGERVTVGTLEKRSPQLYGYYTAAALSGGAQLSEGRVIGGNPTDKALAESILDIKRDAFVSLSEKIPFDSKRKYSAARISGGRGNESYTVIKGAPEIILPHVRYCILADGRRIEVSRRAVEGYLSAPAEEGWRVIVLAVGEKEIASPERFGELTLICGVMIADKPRREARASVESLRSAGVQVVMITGDNSGTAIAVAKKCGIFKGGRDVCLTGRELSELDDGELSKILPDLRVVSRALPSDKSRLVRIAQEKGLVVGMTGDGVNDAPALKTADIGFAVGSGTQVAKEAGDIIILDDNLASIVKAVLYGRTIFKSIRKFIVLQLTINLCAVGVTMIGPFIGIDSPVTVVQMLWINIIMDTLGGMAFAGEAPRDAYMREKPKKRDEAILNGYMINQIAVLGAFTVGVCIAFLKHPAFTTHFRGGENGIHHLTAFFALFIFAGVFNCFNARTDSLDLFSGIGKNKAFISIMSAVLIIQIAFVYLGGSVLRTVPLSASELLGSVAPALLVFPADTVRKIGIRIFGRHGRY